MGIDRTSRISVVARAVLRELFDALPRLPTAFPHRHFPTGIVGLWSGFCRSDNAPSAVCFEVERSHVVVAVGCGDGVGAPVASRPLQQGPGARAIFRARFITFAGDDEDDGIPLWVEANVFEIDLESFGCVIAHEGVVVRGCKRNFDGFPSRVLPGLSKVGGFEIVEVGAPVDAERVGMIVKGCDGFLAGAYTDLIMSFFDGGQARPFGPFDAVGAGHEEEGAVSRVFVARDKVDEAAIR